MLEPAANELIGAAEIAQEAARTHKRAASYHRRQAQTQMARLAEIRRECVRLGITLEITETPGRESE